MASPAEARSKRSTRSPIIFRFKVADGDQPCAASDGKFVLQRGPFHEGGCPVNPEDDQGRLPDAVLLTPDVSVAVSTASDNPVALGGPVDTC